VFKNVAAKFMVFAFDTTNNTAKTGDAANITAYVSKDYGTVTVLADTSATEMDATNAKGYYLFDAAQGETNADVLMVSAKSATANIAVIGAPAVIYTRPTTGWLAPTTAGRTLDVSAGGESGVDWANVGSPTTAVDLSGTTIKTTQKVDVDTIKTNPVVNAGTITFPTTATLASTTNITAGTITTATNVTTVNGLAANVITAAATAADFGTEVATAVWTDTTAGDFTVAASIGKSVMNGVALGTGLTANAVTTVNGLAANVITAAATAADFGTEVAAAVWDMDATGHQTQGTFGQAIGDPVADTGTIFKATVTDATGATVGADTATLLTRLGTPSDLGGGATVAANLSDIEAQTDDIGAAGAGLTAINLPDQTMNITGDITGNLSGSVGSVTGAVGSVTAGVTVTTNNDKTGYALSAAAVDAVLDDVVEGTTTFRQMLRGFAAALLAKASGLATTTAVFRDIGDTKDRITATVDSDGNRTAITLDLT
jgi:hypothetical protein